MTKSKTFDLVVKGDSAISVPSYIADNLDATDAEGYEEARDSFPIVSIRNEELKDKGGKVIAPAGGFRIYDRAVESSGGRIEDAPGPLVVTIVWEYTSRKLWGSESETVCRSNNGQVGEGTPGGSCLECPNAQWIDNEKPKCTEEKNLICYDHANGTYYNFTIKRTQLRPWNDYKSLLKRMGGIPLPPHAMMTEVSTLFIPAKGAKKAHYVPRFNALDTVEGELFQQFKAMRKELGHVVVAGEEHSDVVDDGDII